MILETFVIKVTVYHEKLQLLTFQTHYGSMYIHILLFFFSFETHGDSVHSQLLPGITQLCTVY